MKVLIFVNRFPVVSETFIINQVEGLLETGAEIEVATLVDCSATCLNQLSGFAPVQAVFRDEEMSRSGTWLAVAKSMVGLLLHPQRWQLFGPLVSLLAAGNVSATADLLLYGHFLKLADYDLVICHFGPQGGLANYLRSSGLLGGPIATYFHGYDMSDRRVLRQNRRAYQALFQDTEMLMPTSRLWCEKLVQMGAPEAKLAVYRMGIVIPKPGSVSTELHQPLRILTVGRLVDKKGIAYAIKGVIGSALPVDYRIVGSGPLHDSLQQLAGGAVENQSISMLGTLPNSEVLELMDWADVFILTSVTAQAGDMEGVPIVLMEAMSRNLLVIASTHSGNTELVEHGVNGFMVPERDPVKIAAVLGSLKHRAPELAGLRQAARTTVVEHFDSMMNARVLLRDLAQLGRF